MRGVFPTSIFPEAVPNNHTPPDDDIERNLCVELYMYVFVVVDVAHFHNYIFLLLISVCDS